MRWFLLSQEIYYIGERYRLHERMLRNRRDTKGLNVLFPGLAGASLYQWEIPKDSISLEYLILEYLSTYHSGDVMSRPNYYKIKIELG